LLIRLDTDFNNATPERAHIPKSKIAAALGPSDPKTQKFLAIAHDIYFQTVHNTTGYLLDLMLRMGYKGVTMGECLGDPRENWYRRPIARAVTASVFAPRVCGETGAVEMGISTTSTPVLSTESSTSL
jgi:hypothetical protein